MLPIGLTEPHGAVTGAGARCDSYRKVSGFDAGRLHEHAPIRDPSARGRTRPQRDAHQPTKPRRGTGLVVPTA
ncbi:hypothetical protein GCM10027053_42850 [Intrasporangium mesophilum]